MASYIRLLYMYVLQERNYRKNYMRDRFRLTRARHFMG
jgi:hypothetical protein